MLSLVEPMARTKRVDTAVKVDLETVRKAKIVAAFRDITLAEYLSEVLAPIVERDLSEAVAKQASQGKPPKR